MKVPLTNFVIKVDPKIVQSYLRHLVTVAVGIVVATAAAHHTSFLNLTQKEWLEAANALWISLIPQVRHFVGKVAPEVAPLVDSVLPVPRVATTVTSAPVATATSATPTA